MPHRFSWTRRLGAAFAILAAVALLLRMVAGYVEGRRLERAVEELRAQGEPLAAAELGPPAVRDEDNAATYLRRALESWPRIPGDHGAERLVTQTQWGRDSTSAPDPILDDRAYLTRCAPAIDLVRQAQRAPACHWGRDAVRADVLRFGRPPHVEDVMHVVLLLSDAATRSHRLGEHRSSIELIELALAAADRIAAPGGTVNHVAASGTASRVLQGLEAILPELRVGPPPAAAPEQLERLTQRLLDGDAASRALAASLRGQRALVHEAALSLIGGRDSFDTYMFGVYPLAGSDGFTRLLIGPILQRDARLVLQSWPNKIRAASQARSLPDFVQATGDEQAEGFTARVCRPITFALGFSSRYGARAHFVYRDAAHMAAAAIAIRRYEFDHGRRPETLAELVPHYLPRIPLDPLDPAGLPVRYRPDGVLPERLATGWDAYSYAASIHRQYAQRNVTLPETPLPIVYSVGLDGVDHGGKIRASPQGVRLERDFATAGSYDDHADHYFLLDAPPDPPLPYEAPAEGVTSPPGGSYNP